jgi:crotonobetainyl-CoA:carnitine CoA-transferase CaiB-like acyl-CoA transferase
MPLLTGIRVLDFGRFIAAPYCAALLGDLGADVIRIERVEGGEDRYVPHVTEAGEGGLYLQMNRNKRCLTLDLASSAGRLIVRQLVGTADVVVANLPPATLEQLGLDYATLSALNPRIVLAAVTAYGPGGPYSDLPGFDSIGQAMSGAMFMSGHPDAPVRAGVPYVDVSTAQALAMGALAALWSRERSGRGQQVEGSLLRSALVIGNAVLIEQALKAPDRVPQGNRGYTAAPSDLFRAADGWLVVQTIGQAMFERWCRMVGRAELIDDPRFADDEQRGNHSRALSAVMAEWCATRTREAVLAALAQAKIPAAPVFSPQQALNDPHIRAAGLLRDRPVTGSSQLAPLAPHPVDMSVDAPAFGRPAPALGQHTREILAELGYDDTAIAALRAQGVV